MEASLVIVYFDHAAASEVVLVVDAKDAGAAHCDA